MIETDAMGAPIEVADLDAEWLLALAQEAATECWKAERRRLRLAAQWCVLHPATVESGFVTWSDTGLPGLDATEKGLGGEGTLASGGVHPRLFARFLTYVVLRCGRWIRAWAKSRCPCWRSLPLLLPLY